MSEHRAVALRSIEPEDAGPVPEVVEVIEQLLERARAGEVIGFSVGMVLTRGAVEVGFVQGAADMAALHYAAATNAHRILVHEDDE